MSLGAKQICDQKLWAEVVANKIYQQQLSKKVAKKTFKFYRKLRTKVVYQGCEHKLWKKSCEQELRVWDYKNC